MPATKKQDLRLEILDELLSAGKWTTEELLARVNSRIADHSDGIDKRTLFRDVKYLIEQKDAPIHRPEKGDNRYYYTERFSLRDLPLDEDDIAILKNARQILKEVDNFELVKDLDEVVRKLENRIHLERGEEPVFIQFEKHTSSRGTEHIHELLEAIKSRNALKLTYQPFTHPEPTERVVHPYLLKEFRSRWFLLGREGHAARVTNYALDRIKRIRPSGEPFLENDLLDPAQYFNHMIGVSVPEGAKPEKIEIKVDKQAAPYVLSKPIHLNQEILKRFKDGSLLLGLTLIINYELKSVLLSYGPGLQVRKPATLREELKEILKEMLQGYG